MLARRGTLHHPWSGRIELPLLVPAFTSKGFQFHRDKDGREYSDVSCSFLLSGRNWAASQPSLAPTTCILIISEDLTRKEAARPIGCCPQASFSWIAAVMSWPEAFDYN